MRIPRTRGAVSGVLLFLLGVWGALVPFVGHYFGFVVGSDKAWDLTAGRFWLSLLPGCLAALGGVVLIRSAHRARAGLGAWLGIVAGIWFTGGPQVSTLWNHGVAQTGPALGGATRRAFELLAYFHGLGAATIAVAAFALGRLAVRSVRDAEYEARTAAPAAVEAPVPRDADAPEPAPVGEPDPAAAPAGTGHRRGRFRRRRHREPTVLD